MVLIIFVIAVLILFCMRRRLTCTSYNLSAPRTHPFSMPPSIANRIFMYIYNKFGAAGLIAFPFLTLTTEKICYDTFQAFRGSDIYSHGPREGARGGFPSGGSELPSFSLIPVQKWEK